VGDNPSPFLKRRAGTVDSSREMDSNVTGGLYVATYGLVFLALMISSDHGRLLACALVIAAGVCLPIGWKTAAPVPSWLPLTLLVTGICFAIAGISSYNDDTLQDPEFNVLVGLGLFVAFPLAWLTLGVWAGSRMRRDRESSGEA
jgi:hypothetical protein